MEPEGKNEPNIFFRKEKHIKTLGTRAALTKMRAEASLGS